LVVVDFLEGQADFLAAQHFQVMVECHMVQAGLEGLEGLAGELTPLAKAFSKTPSHLRSQAWRACR
jgi:hypothetical protein